MIGGGRNVARVDDLLPDFVLSWIGILGQDGSGQAEQLGLLDTPVTGINTPTYPL